MSSVFLSRPRLGGLQRLGRGCVQMSWRGNGWVVSASAANGRDMLRSCQWVSCCPSQSFRGLTRSRWIWETLLLLPSVWRASLEAWRPNSVDDCRGKPRELTKEAGWVRVGWVRTEFKLIDFHYRMSPISIFCCLGGEIRKREIDLSNMQPPPIL